MDEIRSVYTLHALNHVFKYAYLLSIFENFN